MRGKQRGRAFTQPFVCGYGGRRELLLDLPEAKLAAFILSGRHAAGPRHRSAPVAF